MSVTDPFGKSLHFGYVDTPDTAAHCSEPLNNGVISTMTDPGGKVFTYGYSGGQLTSVAFPDGTSRHYAYSGGWGLLTNIIDENNATYATYTYDSYGRGLYSQHAGVANAVSVSYAGWSGVCW